MWTKSYSVTTTDVTKEQMWNLFADVNKWPSWDEGIEFTELKGNFEKGNSFILKPKGGPKIRVELLETVINKGYLDVTAFPLAKMYGSHDFEETPEGLKITITISVKGILAFLWVKIVVQDIVKGLPADVKKQIETAGKL
ncbi:SRPBCC family protein [Mucilaginibacter sp. BJC16-A38]|uniref:SRPBCC family protein n=1 Tax=Mucilaginibacter phenanthrenivorans TaxID=1234842 RepID=UPI00215728D9|nr:SRPBCC family protein [Mucilaginibacter phenanthrenivorans]MCR8561363.1 SRPBCC family protein [Mucilaginibacter phenanthrenivorans]